MINSLRISALISLSTTTDTKAFVNEAFQVTKFGLRNVTGTEIFSLVGVRIGFYCINLI